MKYSTVRIKFILVTRSVAEGPTTTIGPARIKF